MSPGQTDRLADRDDLGPLSPDAKRRRFNVDQGPTFSRVMPPHYGVNHPGTAVGPGTPFPFGQVPPPHPYPPGAVHVRRESLPTINGVVNPPNPMGPPPRPGMGYSQHRLSQGHIPLDRSLTLPPLQTARPEATRAATEDKSVEEQIMGISFRYKIKVLHQVAPPAMKAEQLARGPLIAVEGDSAEAAEEFAQWLRETLSSSSDLTARLIEGPKLSASGGKEEVMAQYHRLASDWLFKSKHVLESITIPPPHKAPDGSAMPEAAPSSGPQTARKIDENYSDTESDPRDNDKSTEADKADDKSDQSASIVADSMDVYQASKPDAAASTNNKSQAPTAKPVSIIANYSLSTSNLVACLIPLGPNDPYSPNDHWQWTATQWRGIIGPDLTIYVRDGTNLESGRPSVEIENVDGKSDVGLMVMRRTMSNDQNGGFDGAEVGSHVEASVLRRMGFEVGEWVRAFGNVGNGNN